MCAYRTIMILISVWASLYMLVGCLHISFCEMSFQILACLKKCVEWGPVTFQKGVENLGKSVN